MTARCELWRYSFLGEAAAEAREASARYWAKGGPADKKYPMQPIPWWPEAPEVDPDPEPARTRRGKAWE